jgi:hypothetical protein
MPLFFLDRSIHLLPYALMYDQTVMQQSLPKNIPLQDEWYKLELRYSSNNAQEEELPPGWTRTEIDFQSATTYSPFPGKSFPASRSHPNLLDKSQDKYPPQIYYTHETLNSVKFCYPMPLRDENAVSTPTGRYLYCSTERTTFNLKPSQEYIHKHE